MKNDFSFFTAFYFSDMRLCRSRGEKNRERIYMRDTSLVYPVDSRGRVLLGRKKRDIGHFVLVLMPMEPVFIGLHWHLFFLKRFIRVDKTCW